MLEAATLFKPFLRNSGFVRLRSPFVQLGEENVWLRLVAAGLNPQHIFNNSVSNSDSKEVSRRSLRHIHDLGRHVSMRAIQP
jgi:hypothetical protein